MDKNERIKMLYEAQDKIGEAIELIEEAVKGTDFEKSANAYILGHLRNWAEGHNPYDETIPKIINGLGGEGY